MIRGASAVLGAQWVKNREEVHNFIQQFKSETIKAYIVIDEMPAISMKTKQKPPARPEANVSSTRNDCASINWYTKTHTLSLAPATYVEEAN